MHKQLIALTVGGAALFGAATTVAADGGGRKVLDLRAHQVDATTVDSASGFVGTRFVGIDDVHDAGTRAGRGVRSCEVISAPDPGAAVFQCTITLELPRGTLTLQAMPTLTEAGLEDAPAAVTGGTGAYDHARGDAVIEEVSPTELAYRIDLR
jgi:hypothetical protein